MTYRIAPSLLAADIMNLGAEIAAVIDAGADLIHLDIMDNHYVPNLTLGSFVCQQIHSRFPALAIDVHLMASPVDALIEQFAKAGATRISIHPESTHHLDRSLRLIRSHDCEVGLVLNPATSPDCLDWCKELLDFVVVMTVNPGFGGQSLIESVVGKISLIHTTYPGLAISVDGGVDLSNIKKLATAGATQFVAGSAIFSSSNYQTTINAMREALG